MPIIHSEPSPLAGKTVRLRPDYHHPEIEDASNLYIVIEDWWDRIAGKSWMDCNGNPAALLYAMRTGFSSYRVPINNEVLYGKVGCFGHLVHVSEIIFDEEHQKVLDSMTKKPG